MSNKVTVIYVRSLSYTGTTWVNTVLGCHDKAMALGPVDRLWRIIKGEQKGQPCLVHGADCNFWTEFLDNYTTDNNLFVELANYSGKTYFSTNNLLPNGAGTQLDHPDVEVKTINLVRDGRSLVASYHRKFPEKTFLDGITGFLQPSFSNFTFDPENPEQLSLRYEDLMIDQLGNIRKIGDFIGLDYDEKVLRYWEWDQHLTSGNQGTVAMLKLGQGLPIGNFEGADFYREQFDTISKGDPTSFKDNRAKNAISRQNLFYFDLLAGHDNERCGYERDQFSDEEVRTFRNELEDRVKSGKVIGLPSEVLEALLSGKDVAGADFTWPQPVVKQWIKYALTYTRSTFLPAKAYEGARARASQSPLTARVKKSANYARTAVWRLRTGNYPPVSSRVLAKKFASRFMRELRGDKPSDIKGTVYYDEITAKMRRRLTPYKVRSSGMSLDEVVAPIQWNLYEAYGPNYLNKPAPRILADTPSRYDEMLEAVLRIPGARFETAREMINLKPNADELICHVRHDVDADIVGALQQARIEAKLGIKTTYYILHTAPYYGVWSGKSFKRNEATAEIYQELQELGHEVALHTDGLGLYQFQETEGSDGIRIELEWLKSKGLNISGSVTHNSFAIYGAENFAVFKGRPLSLKKPGGPKAVLHDGQLALLQQLDEQALGLDYEGNDFFAQKEVPIQYYALRGQNEWRHQIYNPGKLIDIANQTRSNWFSQEEVVDHLAQSDKGAYAVFVVHPVYYGLRESVASKPTIGIEAPEKPKRSPIGWRGHDPETLIMRHAVTDGHTEGQSVIVTNDIGMTDVPPAYVATNAQKLIFLGKDQIATDGISVDSKTPQTCARILRRVHNIDTGATALSGTLAPIGVRLAWLEQVLVEHQFDSVVLSVGASDLVSEDQDALSKVFGLDKREAQLLLPDSYEGSTLSEIASAEFIGAQTPDLSSIGSQNLSTWLNDDWTPQSHACWPQLTHRLREAVTLLQSKGLKVVLLLEDCGEALGWKGDDLAGQKFSHFTALLDEAFRSVADDLEVGFVNPYPSMLAYDGLFSTHWRSSGQWSIHAHTLAAHALVKEFGADTPLDQDNT